MSAGGARRMVALLLGAASLACLAAGCSSKTTAAQADIGKWKSYDKPGFTAKFPSAPTRETQHISQSGLNVDLTIYKSDLGTSHYTVSYVTYPSSVDVSNPQNNLNGAVNGALQSSGIENPHLVKQVPNTVSGSPGRTTRHAMSQEAPSRTSRPIHCHSASRNTRVSTRNGGNRSPTMP